MQTLDELQRRYGGQGIVKFDEGKGGLTRLSLQSDLCTGEMYLFGAHVTAFQPYGAAPVLFMSKRSIFDGHKPIRGGVPLVFPWFGPKFGSPELPLHGFARTRVWDVESCDARANGSARIVLTMSNDEATMNVWPHAFTLRFIVVFSNVLDMTLEVRNLSREPVEFEEALHSYLMVGNVRNISVVGLASSPYVDRVDAERRKTEGDGPIRIPGEVDRVYYSAGPKVTVEDPSLRRRVVIEKSRSDATVIWNPSSEKAGALVDLGADQYDAFVCVESANARECKVNLPAGGIHRMGTRIGVESLER